MVQQRPPVELSPLPIDQAAPAALRTPRPSFVERPPLGIGAAMTFPSTARLLRPAPLGNVRCLALLMLEDRSIWLLRSAGQPFSAGRLRSAQEVLANRELRDVPRAMLRAALAAPMGMRSIEMLVPCLERVDPDAWALAQAAHALALAGTPATGARGSGQPDREHQVEEVTSAIRAELSAGLDEFRQRLDPEAATAATRDGAVDVGLYNFFVEGQTPSWRIQFARTFPLLTGAAVQGADSARGIEIRAAVDSGRPLVETLAARWHVSPAAIRCLNRVGPEVAGTCWSAEPRALAALLDVLRPQDRPGGDPGRWALFNAAAADNDRLFGRRFESFLPAMARLRDSVHRGLVPATATARAPDTPALRDAGMKIEALRTAFIEVLVADVLARSADRRDQAGDAAASIVMRVLLHLRAPDLVAAADCFAVSLANQMASRDREVRFRTGLDFWPLLPCDYVATAGTRRVVPLRSGGALRTQGRQLRQCLGAGLRGRDRRGAGSCRHARHPGSPACRCPAALERCRSGSARRARRPGRLQPDRADRGAGREDHRARCRRGVR